MPGGRDPLSPTMSRVPIPDFVAALRRRVGHDLLWLPGVTAVIVREDEVLLVQRSDNGQWAPVTGIVDPGEHPADAAVREALEETGVEVRVEHLAWVNVTGPISYPNGDRAQYLDHTFRCSYLAGEAHVADDESLAVGWFPLDGLPVMSESLAERIATALEPSSRTRL